jgi:hypothetical protein
MIGNTERGPDAIAAIREFQSVYLIAVGGAAYLISKAIHSARVLAFADLGMEAIYEFDVVDMPVTVAVDSLGTSVHTTGPAPPSGNPASPSTSPTPPSCNNPPALPRRLNGTKASEFDPGDRIPSMPPQRSWKEAIVAVLQDAQEPLSAADIVQEIISGEQCPPSSASTDRCI